jgi:hypothetical protein
MLNKMLVFIVIISVTLLPKEKENQNIDVKILKDSITIMVRMNCDTTYFFGHMLGITQFVGWINDSSIIINTGCCEKDWFFEINVYNKNKYYLKPVNNNDSIQNKANNFISTGKMDDFKYLVDNLFKKIPVRNDSLCENKIIYNIKKK